MSWDSIKKMTWEKFFKSINGEYTQEYGSKEDKTTGAYVNIPQSDQDIYFWLYRDDVLDSSRKYTIDEYLSNLLNVDNEAVKNAAWKHFNDWKSRNNPTNKFEEISPLGAYFKNAGINIYEAASNPKSLWKDAVGDKSFYRCKRCGYITTAFSMSDLPDCPKCGAHDWEKMDQEITYNLGLLRGGMDIKDDLLNQILDPFSTLASGASDLGKQIYEDVTSFNYSKFVRRQIYDILNAFLRAFTVDPVLFFCCAVSSIWTFTEREAKEHGWKFSPKIEDVRKYINKFISILEILLGLRGGLFSNLLNISIDIRGLLNWVFKIMWLGVAITFAKNFIGNIIKSGFAKIIANLRRNTTVPTTEAAATTVLLKCTMFLDFLKYLEGKLLSWNNGLFGLLYKYYRKIFSLLTNFRASEIKAFEDIVQLTFVMNFRDLLLSMLNMGYAITLCINSDDVIQRLPSYYKNWNKINPLKNDPLFSDESKINDVDINNWYIDIADLHPDDREEFISYNLIPIDYADSGLFNDNYDIDAYIKSLGFDISNIKKFM